MDSPLSLVQGPLTLSMTVEQRSDVQVRAQRALSKVLCGGAQYRLEIGAAIAGAQMVNTMELATALDLNRQSVNKELHILRTAGLLREVDCGTAREVYFEPVASGYWAWCVEASREAQTMLERTMPF